MTAARRPAPQAGPRAAPDDPAWMRPAPPKPGKSWVTEARKQVLLAHWPMGTSVHVVRAMLEALPGLPVPDSDAIASRAGYFGLRRPPGFCGMVANRAAPLPSGADHPGYSWLTADRKAVLLREWPIGTPVHIVREMLEALPGPAVADNVRIGDRARNLGCKRPTQFDGQAAARSARVCSARQWLTRERQAVLIEGWPAGTPTVELRRQMAELPGLEVPKESVIATTASRLGLRRPGSAPEEPPSEAPARAPIALVTRDGAVSLAALQQARDVRDAAAEPLEYVAIVDWGRNNRVRIPVDAPPAQVVAHINRFRVAAGLPRYRIKGRRA